MPGLSFTYAIVTPIPFLQNGYALGEYLTGEADGLLLVLGLYGGKQPAVQVRRFLHVPRLNAVMLFYERPYHRLKRAEKHAVYAVARGLGQPVMELVHLLLRVAALLKCVNATLHLGIRAVVYILAGKPCAFHLHQQAEVHHIRKYGMIQLYIAERIRAAGVYPAEFLVRLPAPVRLVGDKHLA